MTDLHPLSFPHVFDAIIDFAPPESLPTLRQVCHFFRERADRRLASRLSYTRAGAASARGALRSGVCPGVWRPGWARSGAVRVLDLRFERRGHFLDSRLWHAKRAAPRYPSLRCARFLHAPACVGPDPEDDDDMRMQPLPTVIVPRAARCDYAARRGGMDRVPVHAGTRRVVFPTDARPADSAWDARLLASPRANVHVTVLILDRPEDDPDSAPSIAPAVNTDSAPTPADAPADDKPADGAEPRLPMLEALVRQLMEEHYAGHLAGAALVGLEAWRAAFPAVSGRDWDALVARRIRETAERAEYADFDAAGFLGVLEVASAAQWRADVGEDEWHLAAGAYTPHRAWLRDACGWDPSAAKPPTPTPPAPAPAPEPHRVRP